MSPRTRTGAPYLVTASGIPNYGDDFIARSWVRYLHRRYPETRVWVDCLDPGVAEGLLSPGAPFARFTGALWDVARALPEDVSYPAARQLVRGILAEAEGAREDPLAPARTASSIHIVGGGFLNTIWPQNLGLVAAAAELHRRHGVRLLGTGLGLMPHDDPSPELLEDLALFAHLEARDAVGAERFGVPHGLDDAWLGVPDLPSWRGVWEGELPRVVVLLQGDLASEELREAFPRMVRAFLARHGAEHGRGAAFLEGFPPVDARAWPELKQEYPEARFVRFEELWELGLRGEPGQVWLTSRFHAHLLAASTGAAGVAVDVRGDYYSIKHGSLLQAGTGWALATLADADDLPEASSAEGFVETARGYAEVKRRLADRLYPRRLGAELAYRARRAVRAVRRALGSVARTVLRRF